MQTTNLRQDKHEQIDEFARKIIVAAKINYAWVPLGKQGVAMPVCIKQVRQCEWRMLFWMDEGKSMELGTTKLQDCWKLYCKLMHSCVAK